MATPSSGASTPGHVRRGAERRPGAGRLALPAERRHPHVHDLVPLPRARGRLRRRRRRQPQGLGRPLAGARLRPPRGDGAAAADRAHRARATGCGARRNGCTASSNDRARERRCEPPTSPPASSSRCGRCFPGGCSPRREAPASSRATASRRSWPSRRSARSDYDEDREKLQDAKDNLGRTMLTLSAFALAAGAGHHVRHLAPVRARARHRLRPRVRAGAALGRGAGHRAAAPAPGNVSRLARVHGHALRPHPAWLLRREARDDREEDLGGPTYGAGRGPRAVDGRRVGRAGEVRGAGRQGLRPHPRRRPRAPVEDARPHRGDARVEQQALRTLQGGGLRGDRQAPLVRRHGREGPRGHHRRARRRGRRAVLEGHRRLSARWRRAGTTSS